MMVDEYEKEADTVVEYKHIFENVDMDRRKTKVMCAMGSSSWDVDIQAKLIEAGMNMISIDLNLGDHREQSKIIENNRAALLQYNGKTCAVMVEMTGWQLMTNPVGGAAQSSEAATAQNSN